MNGMIFAAGLGTRLRPLTDHIPKALVVLNGEPLLRWVIEKMKMAGVSRVVINVHHFADQVEAYLRQNNNFGMDIRLSDERDLLLDTGGGLRKARTLFLPGLPVLIHNVDIYTPQDLIPFIRQHAERGSYATLMVQRGGQERVLKFDREGILTGWENKKTGEQKKARAEFGCSEDTSFCGIQLLSSDYYNHLIYRDVFSIIDEHLAQAKEHRLEAFFTNDCCWDLGTPEALLKAENDLSCKMPG